MLETCENCGGKGMTHELPPKRCHECKGKGVVEFEPDRHTEPQIVDGMVIHEDGTSTPVETAIELKDDLGNVTAVVEKETLESVYKEPPKPWYKKLFN